MPKTLTLISPSQNPNPIPWKLKEEVKTQLGPASMGPPLPGPILLSPDPMHHPSSLWTGQRPPRRRGMRIDGDGPRPRRDPGFTPRSDALCDIGTLSDGWLPSMRAAAEAAVRNGRPWVLDPVAVSASDFRMEACLGLLELWPAVIRGNASEILGLASARRTRDNKGVDSSHKSMDAVDAAKSLARTSGAIVSVSGAVDFVTDGNCVVGAHNGVPMMQKITATGCAVTAIIAGFVAVEPSNAFDATACALCLFLG